MTKSSNVNGTLRWWVYIQMCNIKFIHHCCEPANVCGQVLGAKGGLGLCSCASDAGTSRRSSCHPLDAVQVGRLG